MAPKALLSYCWENDAHTKWVESLASRLRQDGVETILDQWHLPIGASLTQFMEKAVRENDFVLSICTAAYKKKADDRAGGVGYESDLMTGEKLIDGKRNKFIPILRSGTWSDAVPSWLKGTFGINLSGDPYSDVDYKRLVAHLHGRHAVAPPVGTGGVTSTMSSAATNTNASSPFASPSTGATHSNQTVNNHGSVNNQTNIQGGTVNLQLPPTKRRK